MGHRFGRRKKQSKPKSQDLDSQVSFVIVCYIQLFFALVSTVLLLNTTMRIASFVVGLARIVFVGVGLASVAYASPKGLLLYELAQILVFAFEVSFLLNNLHM